MTRDKWWTWIWRWVIALVVSAGVLSLFSHRAAQVFVTKTVGGLVCSEKSEVLVASPSGAHVAEAVSLHCPLDHAPYFVRVRPRGLLGKIAGGATVAQVGEGPPPVLRGEWTGEDTLVIHTESRDAKLMQPDEAEVAVQLFSPPPAIPVAMPAAAPHTELLRALWLPAWVALFALVLWALGRRKRRSADRAPDAAPGQDSPFAQ